MYKISEQSWLKHLDFILLDLICAQLAFVLAYSLRHGFDVLAYSVDIYRRLAVWIALFGFLIVVFFNAMHDVLKRGWLVEIRKTLTQCVTVFAATIIFTYSVHDSEEYSRITLWVFLGLYIILSLVTRTGWKRYLQRYWIDRDRRSMLLVAEEAIVSEIIHNFKAHPYERIYLCGLVLTDRDATGEVIDEVPVVSSLEGAAKYICQKWIDEVFFVLTESGKTPNDLIDKCGEMGITSHLYSTAIRDNKYTYGEIAGIPVLTEFGDKRKRRATQ